MPRTYDVIIAGAGIIGVSLALELRKQGEKILLIDRSEPGKEASYAGAGMLAANDVKEPPTLRDIALASEGMYPDFVADIESDSDLKVDFRRDGALCITNEPTCGTPLSDSELAELEPEMANSGIPAYFLPESFVDPRTLGAAAIATAKRRGIEFVSGSAVINVVQDKNKVTGVTTEHAEYAAPVVVNCAGAWAVQIGLPANTTRPVKGHLVALLPKSKDLIRHVIRNREEDIYLLPRTNGPIVVGSTLEEAGFDKTIDMEIVHSLHERAARVVPRLGEALIHESWTGLRPGTPDDLPVLGETDVSGYFVASGHFRNGILLAPVNALILTRLINRTEPGFDLSLFDPMRFG